MRERSPPPVQAALTAAAARAGVHTNGLRSYMKSNRITRAIIAVAAISLAILGLGVQPASAAPPLTTSFVNIINFGANKCLDVTNGSTANGALIQLWSCASSQPQQKFYSHSGNWINTTMVTPAEPLKCLDVTNGSSADGALIQQWKCASSQAQQRFTFTYIRTDAGRALYQIKTFAGKCLDAQGIGTSNGTKIQQWTCFSPAPSQQLFWIRGF